MQDRVIENPICKWRKKKERIYVLYIIEEAEKNNNNDNGEKPWGT